MIDREIEAVMDAHESKKCPGCREPLRERNRKTQPCQNARCQFAGGVYRTVEEVAAALIENGAEPA